MTTRKHPPSNAQQARPLKIEGNWREAIKDAMTKGVPPDDLPLRRTEATAKGPPKKKGPAPKR